MDNQSVITHKKEMLVSHGFHAEVSQEGYICKIEEGCIGGN